MPFVEIPVKEGLVCDAYVSQPEGDHAEGSLKPVVFLMDAFGLRDWIYKMVDRIAKEGGYYVVAPNLYFRQGKDLIENVENIGNKERIGEVLCQMRGVMGKLDKEQLVSDFSDIFAFLDQQKQVRKTSEGVALTGYCFGGGLAVRVGAAYPDIVKIVASFHAGRIAVQDEPTSAHHLLNKVKAELYFGHADNDQSMPPEQIKLLEETLTKNNNKFTSELYQGCVHGWTMKDSIMWNEEGSEKHYRVLFDLLKKY
ncbi:hypothetical protein DICPUDRAFT_80127 [Dictyostelium purpureum]|uniref:Dienelactone hydrolase domain-containing protein n=1 Tax=Dictyostelium purpureum TaxID=5786 RepID=F0ZPL9_DICPU|nr:uncharacterized protein DICPUDRAFT_80127 [Dictyostelium purpureum]EGC34120.1 hypothetical protein DICPUDRAFT_80127 [Dictyostelium purpureum]|eukprot:XP_003289366.1 hypothetical protein DICPUDRAFT_80127 [Dictyostelium purpureum]